MLDLEVITALLNCKNINMSRGDKCVWVWVSSTRIEQPKSDMQDFWAWLFLAERIGEVGGKKEKKKVKPQPQGYIINKTWINN